MGERRDLNRGLVAKHEVKRPLARPRHRWENNIEIFRKLDGWAWTVLIWLMIGTGVGLL
jgi:hypothetical protein